MGEIRASTTWRYEKVRVSQPPEATGRGTPAGRRLRSLPRRDPREGINVTLKYRGGAQAWVEVRARGCVWHTPGDVSLYDVLRAVTNS